eukprot:m.1003214 g.1003214  ORF g.1003214 m.1003214 type:complete len:312 (-) comp24042_c0_seq3:1977-2912(-)
MNYIWVLVAAVVVAGLGVTVVLLKIRSASCCSAGVGILASAGTGRSISAGTIALSWTRVPMGAPPLVLSPAIVVATAVRGRFFRRRDEPSPDLLAVGRVDLRFCTAVLGSPMASFSLALSVVAGVGTHVGRDVLPAMLVLDSRAVLLALDAVVLMFHNAAMSVLSITGCVAFLEICASFFCATRVRALPCSLAAGCNPLYLRITSESLRTYPLSRRYLVTSDHLNPYLLTPVCSVSTSSADHCPLRTSGSMRRTHRSRHCASVRPGTSMATFLHGILAPCVRHVSTARWSMASSALVHLPVFRSRVWPIRR